MAEEKLHVSCPSCGKRYAVPTAYAGKRFKCKGCGTVVAIPAAAPSPPPEKKEPRRTQARRPTAAQRPQAAATRRPSTAPGRRPGGATTRPRPGHPTPTARRGRRGRREEEGAGIRGRREPNRTLLLLSGVGTLLAVVVLIYFVATQGTGTERRTRRSPQREAAAPELPPMPATPAKEEGLGELPPPPSDEDIAKELGLGEEKPATEVAEPKPEPAKAPAPKAAEPKPAKDKPKEPALPPVPRAKIRPVPHFESTPAELRQKIDEAVALVADPWSARRGLEASRKLIQIGKPAVPALLSALAKLDFSDEDHRMAMPLLTETLQTITKTPTSYICRTGQYGNPEREKHMCDYFRALWFRWLDSRPGREFMGGP